MLKEILEDDISEVLSFNKQLDKMRKAANDLSLGTVMCSHSKTMGSGTIEISGSIDGIELSNFSKKWDVTFIEAVAKNKFNISVRFKK